MSRPKAYYRAYRWKKRPIVYRKVRGYGAVAFMRPIDPEMMKHITAADIAAAQKQMPE